jgi:hypothetical protein
MAAFFLKKTIVAAINITIGVPGRRADKTRTLRSEQKSLAGFLLSIRVLRAQRAKKLTLDYLT